MTEKFTCHITKRIIAQSKDGGRKAYELYHNVEIPFPPFIGMKIEYSGEAFHQGSNGQRVINEWNSVEPIESIIWNCSTEGFTCYVSETETDSQQIGIHLAWYIGRDWFPCDSNEKTEIKRLIDTLHVNNHDL